MRCGSRLATILPPSSGRMGSRFSSISTTFTSIPASPICFIDELKTPAGSTSATLISTAQATAIARFDAGPAAATHIMFCFGFFSAE